MGYQGAKSNVIGNMNVDDFLIHFTFLTNEVASKKEARKRGLK